MCVCMCVFCIRMGLCVQVRSCCTQAYVIVYICLIFTSSVGKVSGDPETAALVLKCARRVMEPAESSSTPHGPTANVFAGATVCGKCVW